MSDPFAAPAIPRRFLFSFVLVTIMFPTIYGIALDGLGPDAKIASAGLILAIVGGAFMPRLQGGIMDMETFMGTTGVRGSFFLPFICFVVIAVYALFTVRQHKLHKMIQ